MANTNGKQARKKIGGNRYTLKKGKRKNNMGCSKYAEKRKRWYAMDKQRKTATA